MIVRLRFLLFMGFLACAGWMGWKSYIYLFDTDVPLIMMVGLENDTYYCGEAQCCVASDKNVNCLCGWMGNY